MVVVRQKARRRWQIMDIVNRWLAGVQHKTLFVITFTYEIVCVGQGERAV